MPSLRRLVILVSVACVACGMTATSAQAAPIARFTASGDHIAGQPTAFNASTSTADAGRTLTEYRWDYNGDGVVDETSASATITHTFPIGLLHTTPSVKLRVVDDLGAVSSATSRNVYISKGKVPVPPISGIYPVLMLAGQSQAYSGASAHDVDGSIASYAWDWTCDGVYDTTTASAETSHTYPAAGDTCLRVLVTDNDGDAASMTILSVRVHASQPPHGTLVTPYRAPLTSNLMLEVRGATDPDGTIASYEWDVDQDGDVDLSTAAPFASIPWSVSTAASPSVTMIDDSGEATTSGIDSDQRVVPGDNADAIAVTPAHPVVGEPVEFDVTSSSPAPWGTDKTDWDFNGDGTDERTGSYEFNEWTIYDHPGTYTVRAHGRSVTGYLADPAIREAFVTITVGPAAVLPAPVVPVPTEVAPAPVTPPAGGTTSPRDVSNPPGVVVRTELRLAVVARKQTRAKVMKKGLDVSVTSTLDCSAKLSLRMDAFTARKLGYRTRTPVVIGSTSAAKLTKGQAHLVTIVLNKTIRAKLANSKAAMKAQLTVSSGSCESQSVVTNTSVSI